MKRNKKLKKLIIILVVAAMLAGIGLGGWYFLANRNTEPVHVYEFLNLGMTEYWGDSQESYGPVSTDNIQTVFLSPTQTVTEILVSAGDTVQKGDILMTFDTTLSDLALERKRLDVEKLKLQLEDAEERLTEINAMRPMVIPDFSDEPETPEDVDLGVQLTQAYRISEQTAFDGSAPELALVCWLSSDTAVDEALFLTIWDTAESYQLKNRPQPEEKPEPDGTVPAETGEATTVPADATEETAAEIQPEETVPAETTPEEENKPQQPGENPEEPLPQEEKKVYVIFKVTQGDMSLAQTVLWQGLELNRQEDGSMNFRFFDASMVPDHTLAVPEIPEEEEMPEIDFGSGFTSAQIAEMRSEQEKTIKDLRFNVKMAEADYKIMQTEVSDGTVRAEIDGIVVSLLTEEEANMMQQPLIKVSGGGGFYIRCSVSELEKDNLLPGQEVTVNDWNTGMVYTGTVESVGDFPESSDYFSGMGNPNVSYYPFTVFVDESADLQAGSYVNVMYSAAVSENGIYLENPFLRTEQGRSYVYVRGEDGLLEKRFVTTGKSLWGSYTEILAGITQEDWIAFPYGKNVKPGAQTVESDLSSLYG